MVPDITDCVRMIQLDNHSVKLKDETVNTKQNLSTQQN